MEIVWSRMWPKQNVRREQLDSLIEIQANAFQSMPSFWLLDPTDFPDGFFDLQEAEHKPIYLENSDKLEEFLDLPDYDNPVEVCSSAVELQQNWTTAFITKRTIFPPKWQLQAYRTILRDDLPKYLSLWSRWAKDVLERKFRGYLFKL